MLRIPMSNYMIAAGLICRTVLLFLSGSLILPNQVQGQDCIGCSTPVAHDRYNGYGNPEDVGGSSFWAIPRKFVVGNPENPNSIPWSSSGAFEQDADGVLTVAQAGVELTPDVLNPILYDCGSGNKRDVLARFKLNYKAIPFSDSGPNVDAAWDFEVMIRSKEESDFFMGFHFFKSAGATEFSITPIGPLGYLTQDNITAFRQLGEKMTYDFSNRLFFRVDGEPNVAIHSDGCDFRLTGGNTWEYKNGAWEMDGDPDDKWYQDPYPDKTYFNTDLTVFPCDPSNGSCVGNRTGEFEIVVVNKQVNGKVPIYLDFYRPGCLVSKDIRSNQLTARTSIGEVVYPIKTPIDLGGYGFYHFYDDNKQVLVDLEEDQFVEFFFSGPGKFYLGRPSDHPNITHIGENTFRYAITPDIKQTLTDEGELMVKVDLSIENIADCPYEDQPITSIGMDMLLVATKKLEILEYSGPEKQCVDVDELPTLNSERFYVKLNVPARISFVNEKGKKVRLCNNCEEAESFVYLFDEEYYGEYRIAAECYADPRCQDNGTVYSEVVFSLEDIPYFRYANGERYPLWQVGPYGVCETPHTVDLLNGNYDDIAFQDLGPKGFVANNSITVDNFPWNENYATITLNNGPHPSCERSYDIPFYYRGFDGQPTVDITFLDQNGSGLDYRFQCNSFPSCNTCYYEWVIKNSLNEVVFLINSSSNYIDYEFAYPDIYQVSLEINANGCQEVKSVTRQIEIVKSIGCCD